MFDAQQASRGSGALLAIQVVDDSVSDSQQERHQARLC